MRHESRRVHLVVIEDLRRAAGVDLVVLGCTEVGMLLGPGDLDLPVFDTTMIHAAAALDAALA